MNQYTKVKDPCPHCAYKATMKTHLKRHIKSVHVGQKFPCQKLQQDLRTDNFSDDMVIEEYFERDVKFEVDSTIKVERSTKLKLELKLESLSVNDNELEEYFENEVKSEIDNDSV